jgi:signal transduction histidine kinase
MARPSAKSSGCTVLVVDDQEVTLRSTRRLLQREGHQVVAASSGQEALALYRRDRPQLLVVDYFMPGMTGEDLIREIRKEDDSVQILLHTGYSGEKPACDMLDALDIQGYHDKTDGPDRLLIWVRVCLKAHRQLQRVREAERLKGELLANMSHELRTPLAVSLGYLEMLKDGSCGELSEEAREMVNRAEQNSSALLGLITDLLDLAHLERQAAEPRLERIVLTALRAEMIESVHNIAAGKDIELEWCVPDDAAAVQTDRAKLGLVLSQVFTAAIGAIQCGAIYVRVRETTDRVVLLVGFEEPPQQAANRTTDFRTADGSPAETMDLNTVGLAMACRVAQKIGGDLAIEETPETGAVFAITLPIASPPTSDQPAAAQ